MKKVQGNELKIGDVIIDKGRTLTVAGIQQSHHNEGALLFSFRNDAKYSEHRSSRSKIEMFELKG